ncbi:MAG: hypothetical protein OXE98_02510 [Hyphomicrobiales bacterium]|nr:hypothetical protein [Hyphomicrobiales bacterium]
MDTPPTETPPAPKTKPAVPKSKLRPPTILWLLLGLLALAVAVYLASDSRRWVEARDAWRDWQKSPTSSLHEQKPEPAPVATKPDASSTPASAPAPSPASAPSTSNAPAPSTPKVEQQIRKLEQQVQQLQTITQQQRQHIGTLVRQQSRLQTRIGADSPYARQAAMALGLLQLSIASASGSPFEAELQILETLLPDNLDIAALEDFAHRGVAGETALLLRVPSLVTGIAAEPTLRKDTDLWTWLKSWVYGLVRIRRLDAFVGEGHDSILARMESAAHNGNLADAFAEAKKLQSANAPLEDWMESVHQRLELRKRIKSLSQTIASGTTEK